MLSSLDAELATLCSSSFSPAETARAGIAATAAECPELVAVDVDEVVNGVARELGESPVDAMAARANEARYPPVTADNLCVLGCLPTHAAPIQPLGPNQRGL